MYKLVVIEYLINKGKYKFIIIVDYNDETLDLIRKIKQNPKAISIPIIVVSSEYDRNLKKGYLQYDGNDFAIYPLNKEILIDKIKLVTNPSKQSN